MSDAAIKDRRLLLMGGNGGIGACVAERALAAGASVMSLDTRRAIAERPLPAVIETLAVEAGDPATLDAAFAAVARRWDAVDGFVYLTGFSPPPHPLMSTTLDAWDAVITVNLRAAFLAFKAVVPMLRRPGGAIVAVSSGLAINVEPGFAPYSASKAGLIALAKVLAKEVAPDLRVNVVAPGLVDTPFLSGGTGRGEANVAGNATWTQDAPWMQAVKAVIPQRRIATPDDIAEPILFLLGDGARHMTGQTIHINGGRYMP